MSADGLNGLVSRVIAWADHLQREHGVLGFPYAVVKKYGDDEGARQAALITYYGFLSIFPLLLWRGESVLVGEGDRLGAVACADLGEQVVDVAFDGAFADDEVLGDLAVRHAGGDQCQYLGG